MCDTMELKLVRDWTWKKKKMPAEWERTEIFKLACSQLMWNNKEISLDIFMYNSSFSIFLISFFSFILHVRALFCLFFYSLILSFASFISFTISSMSKLLFFCFFLPSIVELCVCDMGNIFFFCCLLPYLTCVALIVYVHRKYTRSRWTGWKNWVFYGFYISFVLVVFVMSVTWNSIFYKN